MQWVYYKSIATTAIVGAAAAIATGFLVKKPLENVIAKKALLYLSIAFISLIAVIAGVATTLVFKGCSNNQPQNKNI